MAEPTSTTGILAQVPDKLIRALPPAFVLLICLNIMFLGVSAWTFAHNSDRRAELLTKIIDHCMLEPKEPKE